MKCWTLPLLTVLLAVTVRRIYAQGDQPQFLPGRDMSDLSIREDTPVGTRVYTLAGRDPQGRPVSFSISGDVLSVNPDSGEVTLLSPLDREASDVIDTIITVSVDVPSGQPLIVALRRRIPVEDVNDNAPQFENTPYSFRVSESSTVGATLYTEVLVQDSDAGANGQVDVYCDLQKTAKACSMFDVRASRTGKGRYMAVVSLKEELDYEQQQSYTLALVATDRGEGRPLSTSVEVSVEVEDVQDAPPVFLNSPYSATVREGVKESQQMLQGTRVLRIQVRDGDLGSTQPLSLRLVGDTKGYFAIGSQYLDDQGVTHASLVTSDRLLDREDGDVLNNGGIYSFSVEAREESSGDSSSATVTIVITDADDLLPTFSSEEVTVSLPEDLANGTPLPGLNLEVSDGDLSEHARFSLSLEVLEPPGAQGVFSVFPGEVVGRSPVIIKVADSSGVDFEDPQSAHFTVRVVASQNSGPVASALVTILVTDSNDNAPAFDSSSYRFSVSEEAPPGTSIALITASDRDSGSFGAVTYSVKGFGHEKFLVNRTSGLISLGSCGGQDHCLDYERQTSFSLTYLATDGGGKISSVNLFIDVLDQNDNSPVFSQRIYRRTVNEGASLLVPPLLVEATDVDGDQQGGGKVSYHIQAGNTEDSVFSIHRDTGEISIQRPLTYLDTPTSSYRLTIRASDEGVPKRYSDVRVEIKVGRQTNKAPRFLQNSYQVSISETSKPGMVVATPEATDPDGDPSLGDIESYSLGTGAGDNFVIDSRTGVIALATTAKLDRDDAPGYALEVLAVDRDREAPQTATAVVTVTIQDVNNKAPTFDQKSYISHISERRPVGETVLQVFATDLDDSAHLEFSMSEAVVARDRTGIVLTSDSSFDFMSAFKIEPETGVITVNKPLNHNEAAVINLPVRVVDTNASSELPLQEDSAEVTIYIQAFSDVNPIFGAPWTPSHPYLEVTLKEEEPLGKPVFSVPAKDPMTGQPIRRYEKVEGSDPKDTFSVAPITGQVSLSRRMDFEDSESKMTALRVRAIAGDRQSEATVNIQLEDINDNSPQFSEQEYIARISEDSRWPSHVIQVVASDADTGEYGQVRYSLSGEAALQFVINETTGDILVAQGARLDRERQVDLTVEVTATDTPGGGLTSRWAAAKVTIQLLDVNDEAPVWTQEIYTAVVPENAEVGMPVTQITAEDQDEGLNGVVRYILPENQVPLDGLFALDSETGILTVSKSLRGKGRGESYDLTVRAMDQGSPQQQFTEAIIKLYIGDVSANDGVPKFVRPEPNEVATVLENSKVGTAVFQVQAKDPDDPNSANGRIVYSFLDNTANNGLFVINSQTGVISVQALLDREQQAQYKVVVMAQDLGRPPQLTSRVLTINVTDVDDNDPVFPKTLNPVIFHLEEEAAPYTVIGEVAALDRDEGDNANIHYAITHGNDEGLVALERTQNNSAQILVRRRINREKVSSLSLTIACAKYGTRIPSRMEYKASNPKLLKVKILIDDLDDNRPEFKSGTYSAGVRVDAPLQTEVLTVEASDADPTSPEIKYSVVNITFEHTASNYPLLPVGEIDASGVFLLEEHSGTLLTHASLTRYTHGSFKILVAAHSEPQEEPAYAHVKVVVVRDVDLMRFVFDVPPGDIRPKLKDFQRQVEKALPVQAPLAIYDTVHYATAGGVIDFTKTGSCFQLEGRNRLDANALLNDEENSELQQVFKTFSVSGVERCLTPTASASRGAFTDWVEVWVLLLAALIGVGAAIAACTVCCLYSRYKRGLKKQHTHLRLIDTPLAMAPHGGSLIMLPSGENRGYEWQERPMDAASFSSVAQ